MPRSRHPASLTSRSLAQGTHDLLVSSVAHAQDTPSRGGTLTMVI